MPNPISMDDMMPGVWSWAIDFSYRHSLAELDEAISEFFIDSHLTDLVSCLAWCLRTGYPVSDLSDVANIVGLRLRTGITREILTRCELDQAELQREYEEFDGGDHAPPLKHPFLTPGGVSGNPENPDLCPEGRAGSSP